MKLIPIEQISPGIETAEDVRDSFGVVIVSKGTELNEQLISMLRKNNIPEVAIITEHPPEKEAILATEVKERLDRRFQGMVGNPLMESLKQMIIKYRCGELQ